MMSNDMVIVSRSEIEALLYPLDHAPFRIIDLLNNAQVVSGEPITNLYRTSNDSLKISQVYPPEAKSFPVFAHPTSMREVARLVINDHVELIMTHGGLSLWKALVESINSIYTEAVAFHETPQPAIPEGFVLVSDEVVKDAERYKWLHGDNIKMSKAIDKAMKASKL